MLSQKELSDNERQYSQLNSELSSLRDCNPNYLNSYKSSKVIKPREITQIIKPSYPQIDSDQIRKMNIKMKKKLEIDRLKIENDNKSLSSLEIKTKSKSPKTQCYHTKIRDELISFEGSLQQKLLNQSENIQRTNLTEKKGKSLSNKKQKTFQRKFISNKKLSPFQNNSLDAQDIIGQCQTGLKELKSSLHKQKHQKIYDQVQKNFNFLKKSVANQSQILSDQSGQINNREKKLVIDIYKLCVQNSHESLNNEHLSQTDQLKKIYSYLLQNPREFSFKALPKSMNDNSAQTDDKEIRISQKKNDKQFDKQENKILDDLKKQINQQKIEQNEQIQNYQKNLEEQKNNFNELQNKFSQIQNEKNRLLKLNQKLVQQLKQNEEIVYKQNQTYQIREDHFKKQIKLLEDEKEELVSEYNKIKNRNQLEGEEQKKTDDEDDKSQYDLLSEQIHRSEIQQNNKLNKSENFDRQNSQKSEEDQSQDDIEQIVLQLITANKNLNIKFDKEKKNLQLEINSLKQDNNDLRIKLQKSLIDSKVHKLIQKERDEYKEKIDKLSKNQKENKKDDNIYEKENKLLFNEMMDQKSLYEQTLQEKKIISQDMQVLQNENSIMKKLIDNFEKRLDTANQNQNYQEQLKETLLKLQKSLEMNQIMKKQLEELQDYEQKYKENLNELQGLKEDLKNRKEIEKILKSEIQELKQVIKKKENQIDNLINLKNSYSQQQDNEEENQFPFLNQQKDKQYNFSNSQISQEIFQTKNSNQEQIPDQIQLTDQEENYDDNKTSIESQNEQEDEILQQQVLIQETEQNFQDQQENE